MPDEFAVTQSPTGALVITQTYLQKKFVPVMVIHVMFCLTMFGVTAAIVYGAVREGELSGIAGALVLFLPGLFGTYLFLLWFNKMVISVHTGKLTVRKGPVPMGGNRDVSTADLEQLYIDETRHRRPKGGVDVRYNVNAVIRSGQHVRIAAGLLKRDHAELIEWNIEDYLRIANRPVNGETR